jgi:hypothetical protein
MRASRSAAFRSGQVGELWREHRLGGELPGVMRLELRTPRKVASAHSVATDRDAQGCVREAPDAPRRHRLSTTRRTITPEQTSRPRPRPPLSRNRNEHPPTATDRCRPPPSDAPHAAPPRPNAHTLSLTPQSPRRSHNQTPTARSGLGSEARHRNELARAFAGWVPLPGRIKWCDGPGHVVAETFMLLTETFMLLAGAGVLRRRISPWRRP